MLNLLSITIWLLTCAPGDELYAHYGHTAIRIQDTERGWDYCFNYGTFSFDTDNFYWKFVKGETYYMLTASQTRYFIQEYKEHNRPVYEQKLNLTEDEKIRLEEALIWNLQPENSEYLYNFVFDNCATRPFEMLQFALQDSLKSHYVGWTGSTYRDAIRHYTRPNTVINGLINMIFGKRAEMVMHGEDALFLPEQLMFYLEDAKKKDGTPLVSESHIAPFKIVPTHWWENCYLYLALFMMVMLGISIIDRRRQCLSWGVDVALGGIYLLLLILVVFLRFFSIHPLVGFDYRLLILPLIHLCARLVYFLH